MLEWLFWSSLVLGVYPFAIYPLFVRMVAAARTRRVAKDDAYLPMVTVITAAFNEARCIEATVRNKLEQDYPADRLNVLVVSDSSEDGTDDIVRRIAAEDARVTLLRQSPRQGKTAGLNLAMASARGDIIVFADANSIYRPDTVRKLVRNFADPSVGYVTGRMVYVNPDGSLVGDGCDAFMRYENALRAAETRIGSIVGVDGGVDAIRRALYRPMRADQLPDFVLPLCVVGQRHRVVYEPDAVLTEDTLTDSNAEFRMRVRVALRALWALWDNARLLNPFVSGIFSWQLASHKLLRYLAFFPLGIAAVSVWLLVSGSALYSALAAAELLFALAVLGAWLAPRILGVAALPRLCCYFLLVNVASAVAFSRFVRGQKQVLWQPRTG